MKCFFTNDVEHLGVNGCCYERIAQQVEYEALPRLLDLYDKYNVRSTFFVLGMLAETHPNIPKLIHQRGHEVASHAYSHDHRHAYDIISLEEQIDDLKRSKDILEQLIGEEVVSFRAPALRVNEFTPMALSEANYQFDSSVAPQRLDAFMSLGSKKKKAWLKAPRTIYHTAHDNLARKGDGPIIEVPVSSFGVPYIGTVMRLSPHILNMWARLMLYMETKRTDKPVNFLFHPSEAVAETKEEYTALNRSDSLLGHLFSDVLRAKLKLNNLNLNALTLLEKELQFWSEHKAEYILIKEAKI